MNPYRKVKTGDPAQIPAQAWNRLTRNATAPGAVPVIGWPVNLPQRDASEIWVRNDSGEDVARFGVLVLGNPIHGPADNLAEFQSQPLFVAVAPDASNAEAAFGVTQDAIPSRGIGRVRLSGLSVSKLWVGPGADAYRMASPDTSTGVVALRVVETGGADVLWREAGTGFVWGLIRFGSAAGSDAASTYVGVVVSPSGNGSQSTSYTVDRYGKAIDSLSLAVTETIDAVQPTAAAKYWLGEVVALRYVAGVWYISKLLRSSLGLTALPGQLCLRLVSVSASDDPTNMMVDLADCAAALSAIGADPWRWVVYAWHQFAGVGRIGLDLSVPVVSEAGWTVVSVHSIASDIADTSTVLAGSMSTIATSQDTFTQSYTFSFGFSDSNIVIKTYAVDEFVIDVGGSHKYLTQSVARVIYSPDGTDNAAIFPGIPPLPTVSGGVDSSWILLAYCTAQVTKGTLINTLAAVNKLDPTVYATKSIGTVGGNGCQGDYDNNFTGTALGPPITVG